VGRVRRCGYVVEWFLGDHVPRHVHVYDRSGHFLGRLDVDRSIGVEDWTPSRKLMKRIAELREEGRF